MAEGDDPSSVSTTVKNTITESSLEREGFISS